MEKIITMIAAGSGILIGVYLVVTNPKGASTTENSITNGGVSFVKALQGR